MDNHRITLGHHPVLTFHCDPYVQADSSSSLPDVVTTGVLLGIYKSWDSICATINVWSKLKSQTWVSSKCFKCYCKPKVFLQYYCKNYNVLSSEQIWWYIYTFIIICNLIISAFLTTMNVQQPSWIIIVYNIVFVKTCTSFILYINNYIFLVNVQKKEKINFSNKIGVWSLVVIR